MVFRIEAFDSLARFTARVDETIERIRALPPAVGATRALLPGEPEHRRARSYANDGIPLPSDAIVEMARVASLLGLARPRCLDSARVAG
jgi:LDH2 family malate/lactate/ureidoglycolate dehydrogenase